MRLEGKIVRFDDVRGYGFIAPEGGGEDVFLHVNDLNMDKWLIRPGMRVDFDLEEGERGKFATSVQPHAEPAGNGHSAASEPDTPSLVESRGFDADELSDLLTPEELRSEITEMILQAAPTVSGEQLVEIRRAIEAAARRHGWIEA